MSPYLLDVAQYGKGDQDFVEAGYVMKNISLVPRPHWLEEHLQLCSWKEAGAVD